MRLIVMCGNCKDVQVQTLTLDLPQSSCGRTWDLELGCGQHVPECSQALRKHEQVHSCMPKNMHTHTRARAYTHFKFRHVSGISNFHLLFSCKPMDPQLLVNSMSAGISNFHLLLPCKPKDPDLLTKTCPQVSATMICCSPASPRTPPPLETQGASLPSTLAG